MRRTLLRLAFAGTSIVFGLLPTSCERELLQTLTPYLLHGGNTAMVDLIFAAAPFVLP